MRGCDWGPLTRRREETAFRWNAVGVFLVLVAAGARVASCLTRTQNFALHASGVVESWHSWAKSVTSIAVGFALVPVVLGWAQKEKVRGGL